MNKVKIIGIGIVAAVVAFLGASYLTKPQTVEKVADKVGAVATLDGISWPYTSINGLRQYYYNQNITASSSVICSIVNPFQATTTLIDYTLNVRNNGIGSAQTLYLSTSTTAFASSTPAFVNAFSAPAGQFSMVWLPQATTTNALVIGADVVSGRSNIVIGPSEYLTLRVATGTPGTFSSYYTGTCKGYFQQL